MPGRIVRAVLRSDATIGPLVGDRVYPVDQTPHGAALPAVGYEVQSNTPDADLTGAIAGYLATVVLTVVASTYEGVHAILRATPAAFASASGSVGGVTVEGAEVNDLGDEPNGPIDLNGRTGYVGSVTVTIYHRG